MAWKLALCVAALSVLVPSVRAGPATGHTNAELEDGVKALFRVARPGLRAEPNVSLGCMIEHCALDSAECMVNEVCRKSISCAGDCMGQWDSDPSKEKFKVQNCTNKCAFTYEDKTSDKFMGCLVEHNCISFPSIPNTCRVPNPGVHPMKNLSLDDMKGSWWVLKGLHPVYDCYPCQHPAFAPVNATAWTYSPTYKVYLVDNSTKLVSQRFIMPYEAHPPNNKIPFAYYDTGLQHYETWWLLDKAQDGSFILTYYCGNTLQWYYEGALVLARNRTLSETAYKNIATAYEKTAGITFSEFCDSQAGPEVNCPD